MFLNKGLEVINPDVQDYLRGQDHYRWSWAKCFFTETVDAEVTLISVKHKKNLLVCFPTNKFKKYAIKVNDLKTSDLKKL